MTMLIRVLPCATQFIDHLDQALRQAPHAQRLTMKQRYFLAFVISAMILTQKLCWATMERRSLGQYTSAALWWMFYRSEIVWHLLLRISVLVIIDRYGLSEGNLLIDDTSCGVRKSSREAQETDGVSRRLSPVENIQQAYGRQGAGENDANCLTQVPFAGISNTRALKT
ncbi:hypothetical protein ACTL6P_13050 [Endozoicomonas acroporae]|uniref:hypothetical protein n=2 Tax=Endozoicomonas acroporae TaxID=1701104 RepID=UPI0011AEDFBC|nr:hypothetical protein [Endozoicomonas acroporae]